MYQNDHLKWKAKFLCLQSLVLEVKGLKQGYFFKNRPFYISFVQEKNYKKFSTYLPNFLQGVT